METNTVESPDLNQCLSGRWLNRLCWIYAALPAAIFFLGWVKWYIAVPAVLLLAFSFVRYCLKGERWGRPFSFRSRNEKDCPRCFPAPAWKKLLLVLLLILSWTFLSGIGGYVFQNTDHRYRNEIFRLLVENPWPVVKMIPVDGQTQPMMLSYYIGFWLPAALVGKVFGLGAGFFFQYLWAALGIFLVFVKMSSVLKRRSVWAFLLFVFFSGLDLVGCWIMGRTDLLTGFQDHLEFWTLFQYSSHTTQLFWVFHQAIYGWLLTLMILDEKENRQIVLFLSFGVLTCTFPFVGMIPFAAYRVWVNWKREENHSFGTLVKGLFTPENVLAGGMVGIVTFLYLQGNSSAGNFGSLGSFRDPEFVKQGLLFVFLEAWVWYLAIARYQRKNPLFWITLGILSVSCFIRVGEGIDFGMRVTIPSLLVLSLLVCDSLRLAWKKKQWISVAAMLVIFAVGSITPLHEMARTIGKTGEMKAAGQPFMEYVGQEQVLSEPNFSTPAENSLFYRVLAR